MLRVIVDQQEAQLPLRNRASVTYFFVAKLLSIAVTTCSYIYHLQSLRPMIRLIYDAHSFQHVFFRSLQHLREAYMAPRRQ